MAKQHRSGVVHTYATDVRAGDTIRIDGEELKVISRDYPPITRSVFEVTLPDGSTRTMGKLTQIEILDPTGEVTQRIIELNLRHLAIGTRDEQPPV